MPKVVEHTSKIAAAYLRHNSISLDDVPDLIRDIAEALHDLGHGKVKSVPAVPIEQSVCKQYLVCLEDGKRVTLLKRHLRNNFGLSPQQYRQKWGLPGNYPMVPAGYSKARAANAIEHGLGKS
tara:strand:- start:11491 stop:11859 length:369 start_codon:yes stop_codon:yes gene_type:complete